MTPDARAQRWLGIAGLGFVVLFVISFLTPPATPSSHASAAKVIAYYHQHKAVLVVSAYAIELAVFEGLFFLWYLRDRLRADPANKALANIAFAGAVVFAVSGGLAAGITLSLTDAVDHVDPTVMQTLNVLQNDLGNFMSSAGGAVFLAATGIALIRTATLPRWLGWVGVVLAAASLVIPGIGAPAAGLWILIASIVMLVLARQQPGREWRPAAVSGSGGARSPR
jgi:hypothetical protein